MTRIRVKSEISGAVWKIEAAAGARVAEDDPIITLESMKMEIPILAPETGTVAEILVDEGDAVTEGQEVAVIDA